MTGRSISDFGRGISDFGFVMTQRRQFAIFLFIFHFSISNSFRLYGAASSRAGFSGADFLLLPQSARAQALGESYVAFADDTSSLFYNPAGLASITRREASFSYFNHLGIANSGNGAFAVYLGKEIGTVGGGLIFLNSGGIDGRDENDKQKPSTSLNDVAVMGAWARNVHKSVSVGGAVKIINENFAGRSGFSMAVDGGILYRERVSPEVGIRAAVSAQNLGPKIGPGRKSPLPVILRAAVAATFFKETLTFSPQADIPVNGALKASLGAEYQIYKFLALRVGYRINHAQIRGAEAFSGGIGIIHEKRVSPGEKGVEKIRLDYAFSPGGIAGDVHRMTFGIRF